MELPDGVHLDVEAEAVEMLSCGDASELCDVCGMRGDDRRSLVLRYFYALEEISPRLVRLQDGPLKGFYILRTCKGCRGDFLGVLRRWCAGEFIPIYDDGQVRDVPVRVDGRTVWMTVEEWQELTGRSGEPVRFAREGGAIEEEANEPGSST